MPSSQAFTKAQYLEYIAKQIEDDEVVIISDYVKGYDYTKQWGKQMCVCFPALGFATPAGIMDIRETKNAGIVICKPDLLDAQLKKELGL